MATALFPTSETSRDSRLARSVWFLGGLMTSHVDAADTNGQFALIEVTGTPGGERPLHVHHKEDERFYVLEGRLKVFRGEEELILEAGDSGLLPRDVPHTFKILSKSARWLVHLTPGGFEEFFPRFGRARPEARTERVRGCSAY